MHVILVDVWTVQLTALASSCCRYCSQLLGVWSQCCHTYMWCSEIVDLSLTDGAECIEPAHDRRVIMKASPRRVVSWDGNSGTITNNNTIFAGCGVRRRQLLLLIQTPDSTVSYCSGTPYSGVRSDGKRERERDRRMAESRAAQWFLSFTSWVMSPVPLRCCVIVQIIPFLTFLMRNSGPNLFGILRSWFSLFYSSLPTTILHPFTSWNYVVSRTFEIISMMMTSDETLSYWKHVSLSDWHHVFCLCCSTSSQRWKSFIPHPHPFWPRLEAHLLQQHSIKTTVNSFAGTRFGRATVYARL